MFSELKSPAREKTHVINDEPSITEQHHKDDCDIQVILRRYAQTGVIEHNNKLQGEYADYPSDMDFHEAQNTIALGKTMFESVPAQIRADFNNDPAQFLAFVQDESNIEKMAEYGLTDPLRAKEPDPVPEDKKPKKSAQTAKETPSGGPTD